MANENLHIDENTRWVLGAITNDSNQEIRNARINPITGRLIVEAVIASTNTSIGGTIPGGTPGSVLFIGPGSTLDQDNPNLFYDYTNFFLGIGTNTPDATLNVNGTVHFDLGGDATGDIFYRNAGGFLAPLGIGTAGQVLTVAGGLPDWQTPGAGATGYDTIQDNGTPLTQRSTMNFVNYFTITDVSSVTTININTTELGGDATLISTLESNLNLANISGLLDWTQIDQASVSVDLATQVTGLLPPANIDITNLQSTLDLGNISGQIDLTTQVTGILGLSNGGTGVSLSDPNYDAAYVWDNTTNTTRLANLSGLSYNSGTNTLGSGNVVIDNEVKLPINSSVSTALIKFNNFLIYNGTGGFVVYTYDTLTGARIPSAISLSGDSVSVSEDGLTLYTMTATGGVNTSASVTLYTYNSSLTLTQTSTYSVGSGTTSRGGFSNSNSAINQLNPFFVKNGHLITLGFGIATGGGFSDAYATDFTISGASLTSPTATNTRVYQSVGGITYYFNYSTVYSGNVFIQNTLNTPGLPPTDIANTVDKFTYTGTTLSSVVSTHTFPIPTVVIGGKTIGGFAQLGTKVGEWQNSTVIDTSAGSPVSSYFSAIYNEYTY